MFNLKVKKNINKREGNRGRGCEGEGRATGGGRRVKCANERGRAKRGNGGEKGKKERKKVRWKLEEDREWTEKNGRKKRKEGDMSEGRQQSEVHSDGF